MSHILAIDQGTTSSRTILFDRNGQKIAVSQTEYAQIYPQDGWVEHDPEAIWRTTLEACKTVLKGHTADCIGITNQRETTLLWDRKTGQPLYNAIVWQDRRTAEQCRTLQAEGHEATITAKTGLRLDPYFSATKLAWLLTHIEGAREKAEAGKLAFGTVDTFLLWRLTGGKVHATDATNASRTLLYNIRKGEWDDELLELFAIPRSLLPEVKNSAGYYGESETSVLGQCLPITGIAGDQQAATIGQACFAPGMIKSTYGTGCFAMLNTGERPLTSSNQLLTTLAYQLNGTPTYALEGSIFVAGSAVQWLRDNLEFFAHASETEQLAAASDSGSHIVLVPAFTGLGAPHWNPDARGAMFGLTRNSSKADMVKATLDAICFQTHDLMHAMHQDGAAIHNLRIDGGMVANNWFCQRLANLINLPVSRPAVQETTALGAAYLAGLEAGIFADLEAISALWRRDAAFAPAMEDSERDAKLTRWHHAVSAVERFAKG